MILGIDIGSTTTKAVSLESGKLLEKTQTEAIDPVTSSTGIIGKLTLENKIGINDIEEIVITGVGASKIHDNIFNIPTKSIDEITAIGRGGLFSMRSNRMIIANVGTGTAFLEATSKGITHLGGIGVGGGTICGLGKALLKKTELKNIMNLASKGDINQIDLLIGDIMENNLNFLNPETTAANFGKLLDTAKDEDMALGILTMVYQVIGMLSVFAAKGKGYDTVVVTGNGSNNKIGQKVLKDISGIHNIKFQYPKDAEYVTAIGAALSA
ncbi:MAG: pantothenate kinase [Spirochaetales bacterium]|nr:pantothenate kinase [Spirochaetales bacterium]